MAINNLFRSVPTLAYSDTWYRAALIFRSEISSIEIVNKYIPTGDEKHSWSADEKYTGSIMCYVLEEDERLKLIISGNGSGKIKANKNSSYLFSNSSHFHLFSSVRSITGLELLDTRAVTDMSNMFYGLSQVEFIDVSHFNTSSVTTMEKMFRHCYNLKELNVSSWKTNNVKSTVFMFDSCFNLENLNLDGWNTKNITEHRHMFDRCKTEVNLYFPKSEENIKPQKRPWYKRMLNI